MGIVFSGSAYHSGPTNISIFDKFILVFSSLESFFEGIEVNDKKVDVLDAMIRRSFPMVRIVTPSEQSAVDERMQCL